MTTTGPNDAFRIIWAIGFFSFFFHIFYKLTNYFCFFGFYLHSKSTGKARMAGDDENRPKQCVWRCLGHRYLYLFIFMFFFFWFFRFYLRFKSTWRVRIVEINLVNKCVIVYISGSFSFIFTLFWYHSTKVMWLPRWLYKRCTDYSKTVYKP